MKKASLIATTLLLTAGSALADPGYYLVTVYENPGQVSLDFRYWTVKYPGSPEVIWPEIGIGYGVNKRWYTELYASYIGSETRPTELSTLNWQNDFLLTQGQYDLDVALHSNLIRNHYEPDSYTLELGPVLQTEMGRTQFNANLIFARDFEPGPKKPTQLKYQWQAKYRWRPMLQFGLQGFGEVGPWDHWASSQKQSHRAGPMISGTLPLPFGVFGGSDSIKYDAALLRGSIYGKHGQMFSMRLQYLF